MTGTFHIVVAMKPLDGNFSENAIKHGVAGLNIDGCRVETKESLNGGAYAKNATSRAAQDMWTRDRKGDTNCMKRGGAGDFIQPIGRFPANVIHDGSEGVIMGFPVVKAGVAVRRNGGGGKPGGNGRTTGHYNGGVGEDITYGDSGSAARFFKACGEYKR